MTTDNGTYPRLGEDAAKERPICIDCGCVLVRWTGSPKIVPAEWISDRNGSYYCPVSLRFHRTNRGKRVVHCWEDGPRTGETDTEMGVGSTCMLEDGHDGPHEFTPDGEIVLRFEPDIS